MTISHNPPALPGELYPVLQELDSKASTAYDVANNVGEDVSELQTNVSELQVNVSELQVNVTKSKCSGFLTSYTIGLNRQFTTDINDGFSAASTSLTVLKTGTYFVTLTAAKRTSPTTAGYLNLRINGDLPTNNKPATAYGIYNSCTSCFVIDLAAGDVLTFEINGVAMWDSSVIKSCHFNMVQL
jgi:hypothetical protein